MHDEAARREHIRRWVRPDFERFLRHDWERYVTPAGRERRLRQIAEYKAAFEPRSARRLREENEAREREQALEAECAARKLKVDLAWERFTTTLARYLEQQRLARKYSPDQPRVPAGSSDGGQWTSGGGGSIQGSEADERLFEQDQAQSLTTAGDQLPREDLTELEALANDRGIRARIEEAWTASNPQGTPREHGFWISRNSATGELFTRPFANTGSTGSIVPGPPPSDAIASFHTHPLRPDYGGRQGPSRGDLATAASDGLPGLIRSHNGMYYFGPPLRSSRVR